MLKSRRALLKNLSLPQLELRAELLAAHIIHKILQYIKIDFKRVYY